MNSFHGTVLGGVIQDNDLVMFVRAAFKGGQRFKRVLLRFVFKMTVITRGTEVELRFPALVSLGNKGSVQPCYREILVYFNIIKFLTGTRAMVWTHSAIRLRPSSRL
jgi:hypothetical protein